MEKVARLARLQLSPEEASRIEKDLNQVLKEFKILDKAKTSNVQPSYQPIPLKNITRKDLVEDSLSRKQAMSNTKNKKKGYFTGPGVV